MKLQQTLKKDSTDDKEILYFKNLVKDNPTEKNFQELRKFLLKKRQSFFDYYSDAKEKKSKETWDVKGKKAFDDLMPKSTVLRDRFQNKRLQVKYLPEELLGNFNEKVKKIPSTIYVPYNNVKNVERVTGAKQEVFFKFNLAPESELVIPEHDNLKIINCVHQGCTKEIPNSEAFYDQMICKNHLELYQDEMVNLFLALGIDELPNPRISEFKTQLKNLDESEMRRTIHCTLYRTVLFEVNERLVQLELMRKSFPRFENSITVMLDTMSMLKSYIIIYRRSLNPIWIVVGLRIMELIEWIMEHQQQILEIIRFSADIATEEVLLACLITWNIAQYIGIRMFEHFRIAVRHDMIPIFDIIHQALIAPNIVQGILNLILETFWGMVDAVLEFFNFIFFGIRNIKTRISVWYIEHLQLFGNDRLIAHV